MEHKRKLHNKVDKYAKYVKEMHWPRISENKKLELEEIKETLKNQKVR